MNFKFLLVSSFILISVALPFVALAEETPSAPTGTVTTGSPLSDLETAIKTGLTETVGETDLKGAKADVPVIIGRVVNIILTFSGIIVLVLFIYGGWLIMTSAGNADKIKRGRAVLLQTTIGIVIILASYAITDYILTNLSTAIAVP